MIMKKTVADPAPGAVLPGIVALGAAMLISGCSPEEMQTGEGPDLSRLGLDFRPNILWLTCEDIDPILSCYGDPVINTPNIDRLAEEGVLFTNAYSVAGVCAPSRCAIITGMYPTSTGGIHMRTQYMNRSLSEELGLPAGGYSIVPPPEVKCFSEYLRVAGYYCSNNVKTDYQFEAPHSAWDDCSKKACYRAREPGQPFFSVINFLTTHESRVKSNRFDRPLLYDWERVPVPPCHPDHPVVRKDYARKYSNITIMDAEIGYMLDELEGDGLLDSTVIFFYSDHGGPLPREKRDLYDAGIHVPLVIRLPGKRYAGTRVDDLVSFVDFAPTVLSIAGIGIPGHMQGQAFMGRQKAGQPRKYIYAAKDRMARYYDMIRVVRGKRFKYFRNYYPEKPYVQKIGYMAGIPMVRVLEEYDRQDRFNRQQALWWHDSKDAEELFDTRNDPYEFNNLAGDPRYREILEEMRKALADYQKKYGDRGFVPETEMLEEMWGGDTQPVTADVDFRAENGKVSMSCSTPGSSIIYKFHPPGKDPASREETGQINLSSGFSDLTRWQLYTGPVTVPEGMVVRARAERIGYLDSEAGTFANP